MSGSGSGASTGPTSAPDPQALFAAEVEAIALHLPGVTKVTPSPKEFSLRVVVNGGEHTVFLGNVFQEIREVARDERQDRIRWFLQTLSTTRDDEILWEAAKPRLRCALRAPIGLPPQLAGAQEPQLCREVLPCLREHVVIDSEASMAFTTHKNLERWEVTAEEAFRIAEENLAAEAMNGLEVYAESPDRIWSIESGDAYESSRLLVPGFLASFRDKVNGRPIAIVPERATLFISGDARAETVLWMCEKAQREYAASNRSVSMAVYTVDSQGNVVPYQRDVSDEAAGKVREAHVTFVGTEYANQKKGLDEYYEQHGVDVFVASFSGLRSPAGELTSYCSWAQGIDALLPRTDQVVVFKGDDPDNGFNWVKWEDALRIGGDALKHEPEFFPPRWRTVRTLTPDEQRQMAAARVGE